MTEKLYFKSSGVAELRAFHADAEDRPIAAGMDVYSLKRVNGPEGGRWKRQTE